MIIAAFYFGFYASFQEELWAAKNIKITELNSYYKGPLFRETEFYTLKNQIEDANSV